MAKFYGRIGYVQSVETSPGVWEEVATEKSYFGDVIRNARRLEGGDGLNDNLAINNSISVMADAYAYRHFFAIRYVEWMGTRWRVTSVEVRRPRLILEIGGVHNGPTA